MSITRLLINRLADEADGALALARYVLARKSLTASMEARPSFLGVETTNICNANCVFCAYQYQTRPQGVMDRDLYRRVVTEFAAMGGGCIDLTPSGGDPFVDPHILERIRIAREHPEITDVRFASNLIIAHKYGIAEVVRSGLSRITISVPGFDEETYQRVFRSGKYRQALDNIIAFITENRQAGHPVDIRLALRSDLPFAELTKSPDMQRVADLLGWENVERSYRFGNWGGKITQKDLTPGMVMSKVNRWHHPRISPCYELYSSAMVFWDGKVGGCNCVDIDAAELIVGDLRTQSLMEIWQGEALRALRRGFQCGNEPEICRQCNAYTNLSLILRKRYDYLSQSLDRPPAGADREAVPAATALTGD